MNRGSEGEASCTPVLVSPRVAAVAAVACIRYLRELDLVGRPEPPELADLADRLTNLADTNRQGVVFDARAMDDDAWDDLLPVATVARLLSCSTRTVERRIAAGDLPVVRDGRVVRIRSRDLVAYLEERAA
jgi:excisionase family DNA binding protein